MNQFKASDLDKFIHKYHESIYDKHSRVTIIYSVVLALLWYRYQSEDLESEMTLKAIEEYLNSSKLLGYLEWDNLRMRDIIVKKTHDNGDIFYNNSNCAYSLRSVFGNKYKQYFLEYIEQNKIIENLDYVKVKYSHDDFIKLTESIQQELKNDKPEIALSNLHTLIFKMIRMLCEKHELDYEKNETLDALFGKYRNHLNNKNLINSKMTNKILKSSVDILKEYNYVRNNQSSAHPNELLNYHESDFICENISSFMKFIRFLEENLEHKS